MPFGQKTAIRLMAIANHPQLSNGAHVHHLPPSWGTLYELTKLPEPILKSAIADGLITPELQRSEVKALLSNEPRPAVDPHIIEPFAYVDEAVMSVTHAIRSAVARWPDGESLTPLVMKLQAEVDAVETERIAEGEPAPPTPEDVTNRFAAWMHQFITANQQTAAAYQRLADAIAQQGETAMLTAEEVAAQRSLALQVIDLGYKALARTLHPDHGGSTEAMRRLNLVRARLRRGMSL